MLKATFESEPSSRALIHLPRLAEEVSRRKLGIESTLSSGELYLLFRNAHGKIVATSVGELPYNSKFRREFFLLVHSASSAIMVLGRADNDRSKDWQTCFDNNLDQINEIGCHLATLFPKKSDPLKQFLSNLKGHHGSLSEPPSALKHLLSAFLTEIGSSIEPNRAQLENELRWMRTLNLIQSAVGWELDGVKLNTMIARVMMQSVGYDYLELQTIQPSEKTFQIINSFQHNATAFGGPLLTVILKPEKQAELLHTRKAVTLSKRNADEWLMNSRLMSMMELESGALIPLIYQRKPNGLLKLFARTPDHYSIDQTARLEKIGRIISRSLENARIHGMMHRMATMDGLTNVFNHRFFAEQITREFKRAQRYKSHLSLLMLDIDYFKQYNDNNGHLQGDAVLTTIGKILRSNVREVDLVCRYGGEEFVVILPETEIGQAIVVAEKIRVAVEEYPFKFENRQPNGKVTVSAGIAEGVEEIESSTELINRADLALYRAKKLGRNRCEVY